ncbi:MAG: GNAT family N-acetyltransferase [Methylophilaceae bacterium]
MNPLSEAKFQLVSSFNEIVPAEWDALTDHTPLLSHAFFSALEHSGSIGQATGWILHPLTVTWGNRLIGAMPLFLKSHSYGEYVFDWAWAEAYARSGLKYYPKLLAAIPFSPITSARLLACDKHTKTFIIKALESVMHQHALSSAHVLFPSDADAQEFEAAGWLKRVGVQFRWQNKNYHNFEAFLQTLSHDKRKRIHQERKKIAQAGVTCRCIKGKDIRQSDWDFFYQCYCNTYHAHHSTPYLTRAFFSEIAVTMPQNIVLMIAEVNHKAVASTFNIYDKNTLYGRYWGALQYIPHLHFELSYYQAQQFCIEEKIEFFEGGAQGEHKLARGFEPRPTYSYHKIADSEFERAIQNFVVRESAGIAAYTCELEERTPFKTSDKIG